RGRTPGPRQTAAGIHGDRNGRVTDPRGTKRHGSFHSPIQTPFLAYDVVREGVAIMQFGLPSVTPSDNPLPDKIVGYVSVEGKESVFTLKTKRLHKTAKAYHADKKDRDSVRKDLEKSGFEILAASALGLSVYAEPGAYEELTGGTIVPKEKLMFTTEGVREYITCLDIVGDKQPKVLGLGAVKSKSLPVDGVVLEIPRQPHA